MNVSIRVSLGEFLDKLSILAIKLERITDDNKIEHIKYEHTVLQDKFENLLITNNHQIGTMKEFYDKLKSINQEIWDIENTIRELEAKGSYGEEFIETARNIYFKNDERAAIKKEINLLYGSDMVEEKSYVD